MKVKVGIIHPQPLMVQAIETLVSKEAEKFTLVDTYLSCTTFIPALARGTHFDLIIVAIVNYDYAVECLHQLHVNQPLCHIIAISDGLSVAQKSNLLFYGVDAFLSSLCTPADLVHCLHAVVEDRMRLHDLRSLTDREIAIVRLCIQGLSSSEIAKQLYISLRTVQNHKHHIYRKIGIHTVDELIDLFDHEKGGEEC